MKEITMAEKESEKLPNNVEGKYYVTDECDGCAYCASVAPENFDFDKSTNTYFVTKQPENAEEIEFMDEAMDDCPVGAIQSNREGHEQSKN